MAIIKIQIKNLSEVSKRMREAPERVGNALGRAMAKAGFVLEAESKKAVTSGPTRALRTGRLRADLVVRELTPISVKVYPIVNYAVFVHEGTYKMEARPFFEVAAHEAGPRVQEIFDDEMAGVLE